MRGLLIASPTSVFNLLANLYTARLYDAFKMMCQFKEYEKRVVVEFLKYKYSDVNCPNLGVH